MDGNFKHLEQTLNSKCLVESVSRYFSITKSCRYMSKTILPQANIKCPETSFTINYGQYNFSKARRRELWLHLVSAQWWQLKYLFLHHNQGVQYSNENHLKRKETVYCPLYTQERENVKKSCFHLITSTSGK